MKILFHLNVKIKIDVGISKTEFVFYVKKCEKTTTCTKVGWYLFIYGCEFSTELNFGSFIWMLVILVFIRKFIYFDDFTTFLF